MKIIIKKNVFKYHKTQKIFKIVCRKTIHTEKQFIFHIFEVKYRKNNIWKNMISLKVKLQL